MGRQKRSFFQKIFSFNGMQRRSRENEEMETARPQIILRNPRKDLSGAEVGPWNTRNVPRRDDARVRSVAEADIDRQAKEFITKGHQTDIDRQAKEFITKVHQRRHEMDPEGLSHSPRQFG